MAPHVPQLLREHQTATGSRRVPSTLSRDMLRSLEFSNAKVIRSVHSGGVAALDLDPVEQRYLLAGAGDASLAIYDTQQPSNEETREAQQGAREAAGAAAATSTNARFLRQSGQVDAAAANAEHTEHGALLSITKQAHPQAHKYSVSAVAWYPVDTGLFVSGGFDNEVKVWDTNSQAVVCSFSLAARVYAAAMSAVAASHCLVAVGSGDTQVMLCDIVSGGFTHTLSGHRGAVWALAWSLSSEWQLVTGGCDGQLRLWDIRRSGPLHIFDEHDTQQQREQRRQQQKQQQDEEEGEQQQDVQQPALGRAGSSGGGSSQQQQRPNGSKQRSMQRSRSGGAGGSGGSSAAAAAAAAAAAGAAAGGSERMFLPDRVTKYSTAHTGSISGVVPTPDGLHWLSAGTDDRVRLWDAATHRHELVHYQGTFNRASRARQLAVSDDSTTLFHPSGSVVQMYDICSGRMLRTLGGGHFDNINCCRWNPVAQELYTGSDDCNIVVWGPAPERTTAERDEGQAGGGRDGDAWSE